MAVDRPNAHFVPNPAATGWGVWGMVEAVAKTLDHALELGEFDYFQLLSPVDLPIRPVAEFEAYLRQNAHDVAVDHVFLDDDPIAFMCFAYRAITAPGSWSERLMWKLHEAYFGRERITVNRNGLAFPPQARVNARGDLVPSARLAQWLTQRWYALASARLDGGASRRLAAGGTWFGANRKGCEALRDALANPQLERRFSWIFSPDEIVLPTLLAGSGFRLATGNVAVSTFEGARPRWIDDNELATLTESGRYFARKFPDDPDAPIRRQVLARVGAPARVAS